ncbi:hypothetical protein [Tabrizicola thermarum]|uniref:hypothetical protein n=1 Tax=Tabrizicola thermarum TaxID=2670345 RepID=UPI000FFC7042|nr:hypothetical protein [Tabrizicola thermarum]
MFIPAKGLDYRDFLDALHRQLRFDWYLEIGSQTGRSLAKSRSPSIAVDPQFRIRYDVVGNKPHLHLYQQTSDDFFADGHLKTLKAKPGFSFLDGMHLFEYLLRDFINTEAAGTPNSVIAMHDCCPFGHGMTTREIDNIPRGAWTGDVWKLIPILQEYRPDLTIQVLDCAPTGLVIVSNLDPKNKALTRAYDEILRRYTDLTLADYGVDRFYASFAYVDPVKLANDGFQTFRPAARDFIPAEKPLVAPEPPPPAEPVNIQKTTVHNVDLYSGHRVLRDFGNDHARCITAPLSEPVDVYVGVHVIDRPIETGRVRIGIQTEQYLDRQGQPMWRIPKERFRLRHATFYDVLLDFSADNAPAYDFLPEDLRAKVLFGPHIFPGAPITPDFQPAPPVFFGALNDRRRALLADLQTRRPVEVAPHGTFGRPLDALIAKQGAVLNLHFREGTYSEYPRFLKAYLRGKPVVSEPLAPPLQSDLHYFNLEAQLTAQEIAQVFENLASFAAQHSFQAFLQAALDRARVRKAG